MKGVIHLRSSAHFQVSRVEMLITGLEIFRSNHCGMHFAKYFPDMFAFFSSSSSSFFSSPTWKHFVISAIQKRAGILTMLLSMSDKSAFIFATVLPMVLGLSSVRTTTTRTELASDSTLLFVTWAIIRRVSLFSHFQSNVLKFGTRSSLARLTNLSTVNVCGEYFEKQGEMG